jgi:hypothetical protein
MAVAVLAMAAIIYVSVPRWGGRRLQQLGAKLYEAEGSVTIATPHARPAWLVAGLAITFGICVVTHAILGVLDFLPTAKYMQPISALYVVPFLVGLNLLMRPATGFVPLLWPWFYALHAILIVAGAPIVFRGAYEPLNMLVPIVGYGLLSSLIGHLYSRWALHSVRAIVSRQLDEAQLQNDGGHA